MGRLGVSRLKAFGLSPCYRVLTEKQLCFRHNLRNIHTAIVFFHKYLERAEGFCSIGNPLSVRKKPFPKELLPKGVCGWGRGGSFARGGKRKSTGARVATPPIAITADRRERLHSTWTLCWKSRWLFQCALAVWTLSEDLFRKTLLPKEACSLDSLGEREH